jgi:YggT family protein
VTGYLSLFLHALAQVLNIAFLHSITEPVMYRVRKAIPMPGMGLDLSPIIIILAIIFLQTFLVGSLEHTAASLK